MQVDRVAVPLHHEVPTSFWQRWKFREVKFLMCVACSQFTFSNSIFFDDIIFLVCCSTYVRNLHGITDWLNMAGGMGNYYVIQFWDKSLLMWFLCDTAQMCNSETNTNTNTKRWQIQRQRQRHLDVVPDSGPKRAATPERNKWQTGRSKLLLIE